MLWTRKLIKNDKVRVYSKFASLFSVMKNNSSVLFQFKPYILWTKDPMDVKFSSLWVNGWEFTKSFMYLKPPVSFPLDFALLFSVMRDTFSVLFQLKLYMVWRKGYHEYTQFQIFDCSRERSPKKVQRGYSEEWCRIWRKTPLLFQKWKALGGFDPGT